MNTLRTLEDEGFQVTYLPLKPDGILDLQVLRDSIREDTLAASIMMVNNELGVLQPMEEIGKILKERKVFFHSDLAQAYGKVPLDVNSMNLDLASISSHKVLPKAYRSATAPRASGRSTYGRNRGSS